MKQNFGSRKMHFNKIHSLYCSSFLICIDFLPQSFLFFVIHAWVIFSFSLFIISSLFIYFKYSTLLFYEDLINLTLCYESAITGRLLEITT